MIYLSQLQFTGGAVERPGEAKRSDDVASTADDRIARRLPSSLHVPLWREHECHRLLLERFINQPSNHMSIGTDDESDNDALSEGNRSEYENDAGSRGLVSFVQNPDHVARPCPSFALYSPRSVYLGNVGDGLRVNLGAAATAGGSSSTAVFNGRKRRSHHTQFSA